MSETRVHHAISDDGTEIVGRVHGDGPPLVLVPGAMSDGEFIWGPMLPQLTDHFECFAMSTRGRGLSGAADDLRPERQVDDVVAFVESIGEPVALMGWSQGGTVALGTLENTSAVAAAAVFEPAVTSAMSAPVAERFADVLGTMGALAAEDQLAEAALTFVRWLANPDELAHAESLGLVTGWARNVPGFLGEMRQWQRSAGPGAVDAAELARVSVPLLLMHGSRSVPLDWWLDGIRHVADHVADPHLCEITGTGHFGPVCDPTSVAAEVVRFAATTRSMT